MFSPTDVRQLVRLATKKTGNPVFDEDLVQEAQFRALNAFRRAGHVEFPRAFLTKIVFDTVCDHWRRIQRRREMDDIDEQVIRVVPCFEDDLDRKRRSAVLRAAMSRLEPSQRRLLKDFYVEDLTVAEIARSQRVSVSAVKMQLLRARRKLARMLTTPALRATPPSKGGE